MAREAYPCQLGTVGSTEAYPRSDRTWMTGGGFVKEGQWSHESYSWQLEDLGLTDAWLYLIEG